MSLVDEQALPGFVTLELYLIRIGQLDVIVIQKLKSAWLRQSRASGVPEVENKNVRLQAFRSKRATPDPPRRKSTSI